MIPNVRPLVRCPVGHNFLKWREVLLTCSYRSIRYKYTYSENKFKALLTIEAATKWFFRRVKNDLKIHHLKIRVY